ncbi:DUF4350 domain-containing protein [Natrinema versiforme]|uniref:DUF4350 domain-containing protein n=1 Tax=Natrinema versiforme TaxID=88724 RepID=A0A4P8WQT6_9EURY|nr:DUF4350 domain-containing protein [Natrinema versiforme]QCS44883.1 DUF4350 domain-containing protein [Natrinema versiforme]
MSWHAGVLKDGDIVWPRALLVALAVATVVALGVFAATSAAAFSPYNPSWDGTTDLSDSLENDPDVESELVRDADRYEAFANESAANETVAFVVAPDEPYAAEDAARIREFVENGGTLVVLENFGENGNSLLADVGAEARVDGRLVRDEYNHDGGPAMPVATAVENHSMTDGVDRVTLNYATAVEPGSENTTVLATTSNVSYLTEDDERLGQEDELGSHPVATVENVSSGAVVVIGDPSIAINSMYTRSDNERFVRELYEGNDRVLLDVSHVSDVPPLAAAVLTIRSVRPLQALLGAGGIAAIAALSSRRVRSIGARVRRLISGDHSGDAPRERRRSDSLLSDDDRAAILRQRHPDWDDDRIRRVIGGRTRDRRNRDDSD